MHVLLNLESVVETVFVMGGCRRGRAASRCLAFEPLGDSFDL
jgi:hypothetical protein